MIFLMSSSSNVRFSKIFALFLIGTSTWTFVNAENKTLPSFNTRLNILMEPDRIFMDFIKTTGYDSEDHSVITDDGYMLVLHRIPGGPTSPAKPGKPVVLVFSGIGANSDTWVIQGPRSDLAFMMVDEGYDVWYLNVRGTYYSKRHLRLHPGEKEFWNFSFHEMALYDAATSIDYVLNITKQSELSVVSHSMGTTMGFILLSEKPEYNDKINIFITFAPVMRLTQTLHKFWYLGVRITNILYYSLSSLGFFEVLPRSELKMFMYNMFCERLGKEMLCQKLIYESLDIMVGDYDLLDPIGFKLLVRYFPEGIADNVLLHFSQLLQSKKFQKFDYGTEENYRRYNSSTPPEYPINKITTHVVLYSGIADHVSNIKDTRWIHSQLPNSTFKIINFKQFHHLDFISCKVAKDVLYFDVIERLNRQNPEHVNFKSRNES